MTNEEIAKAKALAKTGSVYTHIPGTQFIVTGVTKDGKKFRNIYSNARYANDINLWCGKRLVKYPGMKRAIVYSEVY